jgi:hypothetical protein
LKALWHISVSKRLIAGAVKFEHGFDSVLLHRLAAERALGARAGQEMARRVIDTHSHSCGEFNRTPLTLRTVSDKLFVIFTHSHSPDEFTRVSLTLRVASVNVKLCVIQGSAA